MPISRAMWTHGHAIRIEQPERLVSAWRAGFYARLIGKSGQSVWVHYAIPTPVIVTDNRLSAQSVGIRCRMKDERDAWIESVHVFDGDDKIAAHTNLTDRASNWRFFRYDISENPDVRWGVGLSIKFRFADRLVDAELPPEVREMMAGTADDLDRRIEVRRELLDRIFGAVDSADEEPAEAAVPRPRLRNAVEISSVGCDFGP